MDILSGLVSSCCDAKNDLPLHIPPLKKTQLQHILPSRYIHVFEEDTIHVSNDVAFMFIARLFLFCFSSRLLQIKEGKVGISYAECNGEMNKRRRSHPGKNKKRRVEICLCCVADAVNLYGSLVVLLFISRV